MRPNRNIRVGVTLIVAAVLFFGLYSLFTRHNSSGPGTGEDNSANNPNSNTYTGTDNTADTGVGRPVSGPGNTGGMIYTARDDIPERSIITADMLVPKRWPTDTPTANYITDPSTQAVGYITARLIPRGGNIMQTDLIGHITQVGVAGAIRPGFRAMVVPITTKATLHDLVHIGDYVDIVAAFDQNEARTIVQNVRVLAVDVFGKDFPQVKVAMRGSNKADANGVATGNEPSPPSNNPLAPPSGRTGPTPTPTPAASTNGPPPPAPEPALTLEVRPDQATALSLAQSANAPLDFLIHPRSDVVATGPGGTAITPVAVDLNRAQISPFAWRYRNKGGNTAANNRTSSTTTTSSGSTSGGTRGGRNGRRNLRDQYGASGGLDLPVPIYPPGGGPGSGPTGGGLSPMPVAQAPKTYEIPIYADGKVVRTDVVRKPED